MAIKINKKLSTAFILVLIVKFTLTGPTFLFAEDYPAGYLGSGYRDYLSTKTQEGYHIEVFTKMDMRQKERVSKRNEIEELVTTSYQAGPQTSEVILTENYQQKYNFEVLKTEIANQRKQRENFAATNVESGFNYIPYSDGRTEFFKDGLMIAIQNEKTTDEFGNTGVKNTFNMKYDDRRLMISYDAIATDNAGNTTQLFWYGATYSGDSVFYGNRDSVANKNLTQYTLKEIDSAGNVKTTDWKGSSYEGKVLRAYSQTIEDSIYGKTSFSRSNINYIDNDPERISSYREEGIGANGLAYTSERNNIAYNDKEQVTKYHEEILITQVDGAKTKTVVDAEFKYIASEKKSGADVESEEPDLLSEATTTSITENPDGSARKEVNTQTYTYDKKQQLIDSKANTQFEGQEAKWWQYLDRDGHTLKADRAENGEITYSYIDPDTKEVIGISASEVIANLKDGNKYTGSSELEYEILQGKAMVKQEHALIFFYHPADGALLSVEESEIDYANGLVNNLQRVLNSKEHTEVARPLIDETNNHRETMDITLTREYDNKGNLISGSATGKGRGWEYEGEKGWHGKYNLAIKENYEVILGKLLKIMHKESKTYSE